MVLEKSSALGTCRLERAEERVLFGSATSATFPHELTNPVSSEPSVRCTVNVMRPV